MDVFNMLRVGLITKAALDSDMNTKVVLQLFMVIDIVSYIIDPCFIVSYIYVVNGSC